MKLRRFLNVVPTAVKLWASIVVVCMLVIGSVIGYIADDQGNRLQTMSMWVGIALIFGAMLALWLLCLGFVYGDARRRHMRPILWVLVAAFFPHLLGFLLYFVMRHPIATTCTHCGMTIASQQRFCSWCGAAQVETGSAQRPLDPSPLQGASS